MGEMTSVSIRVWEVCLYVCRVVLKETATNEKNKKTFGYCENKKEQRKKKKKPCPKRSARILRFDILPGLSDKAIRIF